MIRTNLAVGEQIRGQSDTALSKILAPTLVPIDAEVPKEGLAIFLYCMDERCATLDAASSAKLANIKPEDIRNGRWKFQKMRLPPFFAGKDHTQEQARLKAAATRLAQRVQKMMRLNPSLDVRIIATAHEGCGGGQALFAKGYYDVHSAPQAVRQHWEALRQAMVDRLPRNTKQPTFEITDLPLGRMRPSISQHFADMALITVLPPSHTLRAAPAIANKKFPRSYQISGDYLLDDPAAIGQIGALAAQISSGTHALPGLVTEDRPFLYIVVGMKTTANKTRQATTALRAALQSAGVTNVRIRELII